MDVSLVERLSEGRASRRPSAQLANEARAPRGAERICDIREHRSGASNNAWRPQRRSLPALGLDVVHMGVLPGLDRSDNLANVHAILDDGVADVHIPESDLVSQRNILNAGQGDRAILIEDQAGQRLS